MTQHLPIYWRCPRCGDGGEKQATHIGCGGVLYRDPDKGIVYCSICGGTIAYFECGKCGKCVNI